MTSYHFALGPHAVALTTPLDLPLPRNPEPRANPGASGLTVDWQLAAPAAVAADDSLFVARHDRGLRVCSCAVAEFIISGTALAGTFAGEPGRWRPEHRRDMLLLPALELALLPFGLLSLHAAAVAGDGWLALFLGSSGSGKSTAAAMFRAVHGGELLADDRVMLAGDSIFGWPANHARPRPRRLLLCRADYAAQHPANELVPLNATQAVAATLAATRFAGLRGLPPGDLPGAAAALAGLMAMAASAHAVRAQMLSPDPTLFANFKP